MKDVMKHLTDDTLELQLVRYHNTQALEKLRETSSYVQMLLARSENPESKRVSSNEVDLIQHKSAVVAEHLRNAEEFAHIIAQRQSRETVAKTISETEGYVMGTTSVTPMKQKKEG